MTQTFPLKYRQPFTLAEAIEFDIGVLTGDITRLVNSIARLKDTNRELQLLIDDPENVEDLTEYTDIIKENEDVIGSQEERIQLIKLALERKIGFDPANKHYDDAFASSPSNGPPPFATPLEVSQTVQGDGAGISSFGDRPLEGELDDQADDGGLHL